MKLPRYNWDREAGCNQQWTQWWEVDLTHLTRNFQKAWCSSLPGLTTLWLVPFYTLFIYTPIQRIRVHLALYTWADELRRHSLIRELFWKGRLSSRLNRNRLVKGLRDSHRPFSIHCGCNRSQGDSFLPQPSRAHGSAAKGNLFLQLSIASLQDPLLPRSATPDFQTCGSETCKSCNTSPRCNTPNSSRLASRCWWEFRSHCSICHSCLVTYFFLFKVINPKLIKFLSCMQALLSAHLKSKARTQLDTGDWSLLAVLERHCAICWWYKKNTAEE